MIKKVGLSTHQLNVAVHGIGGNLSCKQAADIKFTSRVDSGREFSASCALSMRMLMVSIKTIHHFL